MKKYARSNDNAVTIDPNTRPIQAQHFMGARKGVYLGGEGTASRAARDASRRQMHILDCLRASDFVAASVGPNRATAPDHDLGVVICWELGLGPRQDGTVYIRSHEAGVQTEVEGFAPARQTISFLYFAARQGPIVADTPQGMLISARATGQGFLFRGIRVSDLDPARIEFHRDQVLRYRFDRAFSWSRQSGLIPGGKDPARSG